MKLFLSSYFAETYSLLPKVFEEDFQGKSIIFIPTASIPERMSFYVGADKKKLVKLGFNVIELEVSSATESEITNKLSSADAIFVCGGNTFYLLQELKRKGADKLLIEQIQKNKLYIGSSAGSIICSKNIEYIQFMDSMKAAPDLNGDYSGLGVIDFNIVPHFNNFPFKKSAAKTVAEYSEKFDLRTIDNKKAIVVTNEKIESVSI